MQRPGGVTTDIGVGTGLAMVRAVPSLSPSGSALTAANGGSDRPVTENTLFQAASISKLPTAVAALHFVEQGALNLDQDVNESLVSWQVAENEFTAVEPVTLRRLLSHSAGIYERGYAGYAQDDELPSLLNILNG